MPALDAALLLALSAIWGASFMFMRYLAPVLGPVLTADARLLVAGAALLAYFAATGFKLRWRERWRRYLLIGMLNSGLPFLLYSWASLSLASSVEVVINALSPSFGALFAAIWLQERIGARKVAGMALGLLGVALVGGLLGGGRAAATLPAVLACVVATACYGLAGVYIRKRARDIEPRAMAAGSQLLAGLAITPALALAPPRLPIPGSAVAVMLLFALLCSAVAYLIYYRLIADVGPTKALTVTFLMPAFGFLWGAIFLGELISLSMLLGAALILAGTFLVSASGPAPLLPGSSPGRRGPPA